MYSREGVGKEAVLGFLRGWVRKDREVRSVSFTWEIGHSVVNSGREALNPTRQ